MATRSPLLEILIRLLASDEISFRWQELVGEIVVADAAFHQRIDATRTSPPTAYQVAVDAVEKAWLEYLDEMEMGGLVRIDMHPLEKTLRTTLRTLGEL